MSSKQEFVEQSAQFLEDIISLVITDFSGKELLRIDDIVSHVRALQRHRLQTYWHNIIVSDFLELHEAELGDLAPRMELVALDVQEDLDEEPSEMPKNVLRPMHPLLDEVNRCAQLVRDRSDVRVRDGFVGCIPVGLTLEMRLAAVVRKDRYQLHYGSVYYDMLYYEFHPRSAGNASGSGIIFQHWRGLADFWMRGLADFFGEAPKAGQKPHVSYRLLPHAITDMIDRFHARGESLAALKLGEDDNYPDANLLGAVLWEVKFQTFFADDHRKKWKPFFLVDERPRPFPFHTMQQIVEELLGVLESTDTLEDFKRGCGEDLLILVDWEKNRLRDDFIEGETFEDFQTRCARS